MSITKILAMAAAILLVSSASALAGDRHQDRHKNHSAQKSQRMLEKFDANRNGVLDPDEREAMREAKKQRRGKHRMGYKMKMKRFDKDGDGKLSPAEKQAMKAAMEQRRADMIARFDSNRDGQLDPAERQAARRAMFEERAGKRFDRMLARHDSNRDGALSATEIDAAVATARLQGKKPGKAVRMQERLRAADLDRNGLVTRAELVQAARQRFEARKARRDHDK